MRKFFKTLAIACMFVIGLSLAVAIGMYGVAADARSSSAACNSYPYGYAASLDCQVEQPPACKFTYKVYNLNRQNVRFLVPAEPGFDGLQWCYAVIWDLYGEWEFTRDDHGEICLSSNNCRWVEGMGTNEIWLRSNVNMDAVQLNSGDRVWAPVVEK